jgi:GTPase SAR1 family protein
MVGWGKAGKTTLVKRLAGEPIDPNEPETHGIMIRPLTLHCTDMESFGRGCGTLAGSTRCTSFSSRRVGSTCWCSSSAATA